METTSDNPRRYPIFTADWVVITIYVALLAFGWLSICGASHEIGDVDFFSWGTRTGKQLVWIGLAFTLGFFLLMTDDRYFENLADIAYWAMMLVLLVTPFLAKDIKGSKSWISLGAVSLQPAEFAKCVTALAVAKLINRYGFSLDNMRNFFKAASLVLLPMVLIVMQRETGSALVYLAFFLMFYREGMPGSFLFTATAAVAYFVRHLLPTHAPCLAPLHRGGRRCPRCLPRLALRRPLRHRLGADRRGPLHDLLYGLAGPG